MPTQPMAAAPIVLAMGLGGCAFPIDPYPNSPGKLAVTTAKPPSILRRETPIDAALACIKGTRLLSAVTFTVGPFADSTGKLNATAAGATGHYVPQGGSASFITDALSRAGARVVSTYFGPPPVGVVANYAVNGIFNSLDFGTPLSADIRLGGVGPIVQSGWAALSMTIQLDEFPTRVNRQISIIERPVRFSQLGVGVGRDFTGMLATGGITIQSQERLQFEALNGPIALGVVDVLFKEFPQVARSCAHQLDPAAWAPDVERSDP